MDVLLKTYQSWICFWLGAIERDSAGWYKICRSNPTEALVFYGNSVYRNIPRWQIPIELKGDCLICIFS